MSHLGFHLTKLIAEKTESKQVNEIIFEALTGACKSIEEASGHISVNNMSEAVFRNLFALQIARIAPTSKILVECNKIDLVVHVAAQVSYVEFKYYVHSRVFDPYTLRPRGWKSHPSPANFRQFQRSINQLRERPPTLGVKKMLVLLYADPPPPFRRARYSDYYQDKEFLSPLNVSRIGDSIQFVCQSTGHNCHAAVFQVDA